MFANLTPERLLYVIPAIIVALTFHEFAHARVAYAFGDPTARDAGRLTLNPLKHLDLIGLLMLVLVGFGWAKPVPINPYYFQGRRNLKIMAVSAAGPLMNLLEALVGVGLLALILNSFSGIGVVGHYFVNFLLYYAQINLVLMIFNLIPIPPLDGSKILAGLLPESKMNIVFALERYGFLILLALLFIPDLLGMLGLPQIDIIGAIIGAPSVWLLNGMLGLFGLA